MASIKRHKTGWRAWVQRAGVRKTAVFPTKVEAANWAAKQEAELLAMKRGVLPRKTLAEAFDRYVEEVSPYKSGDKGNAVRAHKERLRFDAFVRDFPAIASKVISDVTTPEMVRWRDARLRLVSKGSVQRDWNLISNVYSKATKEWHWCSGSPLSGVAAPGENAARTRRVQPSEVRRLCRWLGYRTGAVKTKQQQVALAILIALRTAMRAGEVLQLSAKSVNLQSRTATVRHKTQHQTGVPRVVPLSAKAARLVASIYPAGFSLTSSSLDALFRKARDSLMIDDLHFHDTRAEALTRLSRRVDVMTLARISGHRDLRILLDTYYRESAADIASRLDAPNPARRSPPSA